MADDGVPGTGVSDIVRAAAAEADDDPPAGRETAVVRALCVDGELSRAIIGYGDSEAEAYGNAIAEARAFCRHHGGTQKISRL